MDTQPDSNATPVSPIQAAPETPRQRASRARWLIVALIAVVVVAAVGAGLAYEFHWNPLARSCSPDASIRHTLPCDIPLPADATFKSTQGGSFSQNGTFTEWDYTSPESLDKLARFYAKGFADDGWTCVGGTVIGDLLAVAATNKSGRPNAAAFMAFQINTPMSPNEFAVVLTMNFSLPPSFKCGNLAT